jgi:hypothetical protein
MNALTPKHAWPRPPALPYIHSEDAEVRKALGYTFCPDCFHLLRNEGGAQCENPPCRMLATLRAFLPLQSVQGQAEYRAQIAALEAEVRAEVAAREAQG